VLIAAEKGRTSTVEILTEKFRASCLERTKDGSTLLHVASLHGHPETALMLLKKGVPLQMPNKVRVKHNAKLFFVVLQYVH